MTYGAHQEEVAHALNGLLHSAAADTPGMGEVVLECRHHVVAACRERLTLLTGSWEPARTRTPNVMTVASRPLQALGEILDAVSHPMDGRIAPTDLLPGPPAPLSTSISDRWRCAARNMMLATHELSAAIDRPWVSSNAALWPLAGDLAAVVEALVVLDQRLVQQGLLPGLSPGLRTTHRLVAGDVSRLAGWFGTDRTGDLSYASPLSRLGLYNGPRIHMVIRPEDLAGAQRTLAALLRYRKDDPEPRAGLRAARVLSVGQMRLGNAFADWATQDDEAHGLVDQFRGRIAAYKALHASTVRLVEVNPIQSRLVLAQQSEMVMQLRRFGRQAPSVDVLLDLNESTHELSVSLGRTLRREGCHRRNLLTLQEDGIGLPRPRPITNTRDPFHVACKRLADDPVPPRSHTVALTEAHRERLRATLDRAPSPPVARTRVPPNPGARTRDRKSSSTYNIRS